MKEKDIPTTQNLFEGRIMRGILSKMSETHVIDWREHLTKEFGDKADSKGYKLLHEINSMEQELQNAISGINAQYDNTSLIPPTVTQVPSVMMKAPRTASYEEGKGLFAKVGGRLANLFQ